MCFGYHKHRWKFLALTKLASDATVLQSQELPGIEFFQHTHDWQHLEWSLVDFQRNYPKLSPLVTIPNYFCSQNHLVSAIISHSSFLRLFLLFNKSLVKFPPFSLCYSPSVPAQPGLFPALSEKEILLRITTAPWEVLIGPTLLHPIPSQPSLLHLQCIASSFFPSEKCLSFPSRCQ